MTPDFSRIFHTSSKDHKKGHIPIPLRFEDWPEEWTTTYYKTYPRFETIPLETPELTADFFDLVKNRRSSRDFGNELVTKRELGTFLKYSCGNVGVTENGRRRRAHPSGGGRYPIETYVVVFRGGEIPSGVYHYNVKAHGLDVLPKPRGVESTVGDFVTYEWAKKAHMAVVMTSVFWRNQNKYGERGYRYILLEAGHIGQNVYLVSEALGLKCCALAGVRDEEFEKILGIDGVTESVVYVLALGK